MNIYAIEDIKASTFNTPFCQPTDVHALRAFRAEVNRAHDSNFIYLYPEDWNLVQLAHFDENTGVITPTNQVLCNGSTLKNGKEK